MKLAAAGVVVLLVGIFLAPGVSAQIGQGRVGGIVTDAQGAVLPGVTVTASSPALIGTQTTVTEANGRFMFPALPSGTYTVTFDLSGFQKTTRDNINVVTGQTLTTDVQLPLAGVAEALTVTGASPIVDITTTKVGTDLKGEALIAVPNSTDAWGALSEAPGVRMQGVDVGGSHKSQQSGYEAFGVQSVAHHDRRRRHTEGSGGAGYYQDYFAQKKSRSARPAGRQMNTAARSDHHDQKRRQQTSRGSRTSRMRPGQLVAENNT